MTDKGTFLCYREVNFRPESLRRIGQINTIIDRYAEQGMTLSVRQLHYQFVSKLGMPNNDSEYDKLQKLISEGRMAGLISWTAIEDRNRSLMGLQSYDHPAQLIAEARQNYRTDLWAGQPWRPEVWIEKAALEGVISTICNELRVDFYACRGYNSQSEQWRAGRRFADYIRRGQRPIVFHLGDHDPSGLDMTRDNRERLSLFAGVPVTVQRLALNLSQIDEFNPPTNPTKVEARSRGYRDYMEENGRDWQTCWELDALEPTVIQQLIRDAVERVRDPKLWDAALKQEVEDLEELDGMIAEMGGKEPEEVE